MDSNFKSNMSNSCLNSPLNDSKKAIISQIITKQPELFQNRQEDKRFIDYFFFEGYHMWMAYASDFKLLFVL